MAREAIDDREMRWSGLGADLVRPMTYETVRRVMDAVAVLFAIGAIAALPLSLGWVHSDGVDRRLSLTPVVGSLLGAVTLLVVGRWCRRETIERRLPLIAAVAQIGSTVMISIAVYAVGPALGIVAIFYVEMPLVVIIFFRTSWAFSMIACILTGYAVALAFLDGVVAPVEQFAVVVAAAIATAVLVGDLARRSEQAQRAERAAKLELADLNQHLEVRVADQVEELERVGQLRRFLAPQVADVVVARGTEALLEPHRRDVAVLFCDLRGFTRFTNAVEPDTVVAVLGEYYAAVGAVLEAHGATIGGYDGDGIMAYVGDPIPRPDAALAGVTIARAIGERVSALVGRWRAAGHDLGLGLGVAYGSATLGVVGFDGRFDYTALGAVVNLAARLCADAAPGEIVIDGSLRVVAGGDAGARHRGDVTLKGFDAPVPTYALLG